ncbi:FAD/NAD(P)-binding protein [Corynebacterium sp.]|uniref:FAD/NAD(P)-binding protein n=1 Tax=Corynebacterium sp. TaxID=1720 RepID=UPI002A9184F2|nr:FAD/NAD(P)-binding protein [Corynebacterium sp.]MDY5784934.1 FAD/NAD(P)-binding protein [Corynebacterium sp.]
MKVAIIGAGPRGLWAAEEVLGRARERGAHIELSVYNDGPLRTASGPGAYQHDVPEKWLLNVPSDIVETQLGSFNEWRGSDDTFPPRREVGRFLTASWAALAEHVPAGCSLEIVEKRVEHLAPRGDAVEVEGTLYSEVLVTTGHADSWPGALAGTDIDGVDRVIPAFAAHELATLGEDDTAIVRGAALTFIDVVRYAQAKVFYPVTRGGRLMDVKAYLDDEQERGLRPALWHANEAIRAAAGFDDLVGAVETLAQEVLAVTGGQGDAESIRAVLDGSDATDPVEDLRRSYQVAVGEQPWTPAAAVGYAFRTAYDAIIARASFGGRDTLGGERFGNLTSTLERVAFGPPPVTAAEVLELIDAGRIRVDLLARGKEDLGELAREVGANVVIDAVNAPPGATPGSLAGALAEEGIAQVHEETDSIMVERDGRLVGQEHLSAAGRMSEGWILGHDTLRRCDHEVIPAWARRVTRAAMEDPDRVHGMPPLEARLEPWAEQLVENVDTCQGLINDFASPVNVLNPAPMLRNVEELVDAAAQSGVELKVFYARKANKALTFVDAVRDAGHGVDVASENELRQVLERGVAGERIILSAAIKTNALLRLAIDNGVVISADNLDEYDRIHSLAGDTVALVAPRLAPDPESMMPTRFGELAPNWVRHLERSLDNVRVVGVHVHLHGYAAAERSAALRECFGLIDALREHGHAPEFIDLGGGVPMSYLAHEEQWHAYQEAIEAQRDGYADAFTWKADPLRTTYPYWQDPTRGPWLTQVLVDGIAEGLTSRGLRLHLEPGRSLLDGCGLILAQVAFVKTRSDGLPLVGLHMNRTQCRTTSDDYLVDPLVVQHAGAGGEGEEVEAFLVGAYCIEDELILRRKVRFPRGVRAGDIVVIPNTAGYFMHILESASHQIPLAANVVWPKRQRDAIDTWQSAPGQ